MENEIKIVREQFKDYIIRGKFKFKNEWWFILSDRGTEKMDWAPSFGVTVRNGKAVASTDFRKMQLTDDDFINALSNAELVDAINI